MSIKLKISFFLLSDVGLSVTTTRDGLLEEARNKPHEPSSKENLIPLTVNILVMRNPSIFTLLDFNLLISEINSSIKSYFS